jgi:hypothetical protein
MKPERNDDPKNAIRAWKIDERAIKWRRRHGERARQ